MVIVDKSSVRVEGSYTEPTTDADGVAITDLAFTTVYFQVGSEVPMVGAKVPATANTGGGVIKTSIVVPVAEGQRATVSFHVTATDSVGLESAPTATIVIPVDRVAPSAPTGFTIA